MKSKCNLKHNKRIDEIDYQDWILVYFPIMRKVIKGHQKIFFYMSDMALFNSYILHITIYSHKRYIYIYIDYWYKCNRSNFMKCPITGLQNTCLKWNISSKYNIGFISQKYRSDASKEKSYKDIVCYKYKIQSETK